MNQSPIQIQLNDGQVAIIDADDLNLVMRYKWHAAKYHRSYYARSTFLQNGKTHSVSMHRLLGSTPAAQVCHHRNRNTLDNRRSNLLNLSKIDHRKLHQNNSLIVKFENAPRTIFLKMPF